MELLIHAGGMRKESSVSSGKQSGSEPSDANEITHESRGAGRLERCAAYASLLLLAAYILVSMAYVVKVTPPEIPYDAHIYDKLSWDLARGHGYNSTFRAPLYPGVLAAIYYLFGHDPKAVGAVQAVMNILSLGLLMLISYRIFGTRTVGLIAGGYFALFKPFYEYSLLTLTECTAILLVMVMMFALTVAMQRGRAVYFLAAGMAAGLLTLCKVVALLYPLLLLPVLYVTRRKHEKWGLQAMALVFGMMAVVLPWTARNYNVTHKLIIVTTGGGFNLWYGNWAPYYHREQITQNDFPIDFAERLTGRKGLKQGEIYWKEGMSIGGKSEPELDKFFFIEGLRSIKRDPATTLELLGRKFSILWFGIGQGRSYTAEGAKISHRIGKSQFLTMYMLATALLSLIYRGPEWRRRVLPMVILLVYWTAVYVTLIALTRYAYPIMPCVMMLSAYFVCRLLRLGASDDSRVFGKSPA